MARPARPKRSTSARPSRQLSRFYRSINSDMVFGTHSPYFYGQTIKDKRPRGHYTAWPLRDYPTRSQLTKAADFAVVSPRTWRLADLGREQILLKAVSVGTTCQSGWSRRTLTTADSCRFA